MKNGNPSGQAPVVIGVDVGGTNIRAATVTGEGEVISRKRETTPRDAETLRRNLLGLLRDMAADRPPGAVVVAAAGVVDAGKERIAYSPNLKAIEDLPLARELATELSVPVKLENDAAAAAVGEKWLGAGRPFDDFILLTLGTGIGGGVIRQGRLLDMATELGHTSIDAHGPACHCGRHGCLEAYASATAVADRAIRELMADRESMLRNCCDGNYYRVDAEIVFRTALEGDILCREIIMDAAYHLGTGVANFVNIFSPQAVIFSGGLVGAWQFIQPEVQARVSRLALKPLAQDLKILPSELSDDAGVLGAARLALDLLGR